MVVDPKKYTIGEKELSLAFPSIELTESFSEKINNIKDDEKLNPEILKDILVGEIDIISKKTVTYGMVEKIIKDFFEAGKETS